MSVIDKVVAAVTPLESDEARVDARRKAEAIARPGDWLSQALTHHREIEEQFTALGVATDASSRRSAQKRLGLLLTGHSIAEEVTIYPALAADKQVGHAELAYQEQSAAKMEMGLLETLDPMSEDYHDKFEHIRGAVLHHIYSEEGNWFIELAETASASDQARISDRYREEYARYMGSDA